MKAMPDLLALDLSDALKECTVHAARNDIPLADHLVEVYGIVLSTMLAQSGLNREGMLKITLNSVEAFAMVAKCSIENIKEGRYDRA